MARIRVNLKRRFAFMLMGGLVNASLLCAPAIASRLATQLHYDAEQIGTFFSLEFGGYVAAGLLGRLLLPRYPWRRIAAGSLAGFLLGTIITAGVLQSFSTLVVVRLLTATCGALLGVVSMASANADPFPSRALALYIVGQLAFGVLGLALLPVLFQSFGIVSYFVAMAIASICATGTVRWLSNGNAAICTQTPVSRAVRPRRLLLRFPAVLLFYVSLGGIWTFVGQMATAGGLDPIVAGRILSLSTIAGIVGAVTASWLGTTLSIRRALLGGYCLLISGVLALLWPHSLVYFVFAVFAFKFAWTFVIPYVMAIIGQQDDQGQLIAEVSLLAGLGLMAGPPVAARMVAIGDGYSGLLLVDALLLFVSGASAYLLRPPIPAVQPAAS